MTSDPQAAHRAFLDRYYRLRYIPSGLDHKCLFQARRVACHFGFHRRNNLISR